MASLLRGDVYWADLEPAKGHEQAGRRPVLILSHAVFNSKSGTVIAVALTSAEPRVGFPLAFELKSLDLPKRSWVKVSQIRALSTLRLSSKLGRIDSKEVDRVIEGLNEIIG
jgi:mRNA interferase MazF